MNCVFYVVIFGGGTFLQLTSLMLKHSKKDGSVDDELPVYYTVLPCITGVLRRETVPHPDLLEQEGI